MHIVECVRVGFSLPDEPKFYFAARRNFTPQELHSAGTSLRQQLHQITRAANIELQRNISKRSYIEGGAYIDIPSGIDIPADRYIPMGFDICFASVFVVKFLRSEVAGAVKFALQVKFRLWRREGGRIAAACGLAMRERFLVRYGVKIIVTKL